MGNVCDAELTVTGIEVLLSMAGKCVFSREGCIFYAAHHFPKYIHHLIWSFYI